MRRGDDSTGSGRAIAPGSPGEELPPPRPPEDGPDAPAGTPVLGGVALDLATRLGIDPVWPRLAFVVLALLDGFGVLVYFGLWLVLIVGRRPGLGGDEGGRRGRPVRRDLRARRRGRSVDREPVVARRRARRRRRRPVGAPRRTRSRRPGRRAPPHSGRRPGRRRRAGGRGCATAGSGAVRARSVRARRGRRRGRRRGADRPAERRTAPSRAVARRRRRRLRGGDGRRGVARQRALADRPRPPLRRRRLRRPVTRRGPASTRCRSATRTSGSTARPRAR